ncbi:MAG: DUF4249 domain-containing protein [Bacteroidota bacterium]
MLLILVSCDKVLDLNVPIEEPRLTINCLINPNDTLNIFVGRTSNPYENPYDINEAYVSNASITLIEDGVAFRGFVYEEFRGLYLSNFLPKIGSEYQLIVDVPGFEQVVSDIVTIPENRGYDIQLESVDTLGTYPSAIFSIQFDDPSSQKNGYAFNLNPTERSIYGSFGFSSRITGFYEEGCHFERGGLFSLTGHVFDDYCFNGSRANVQVSTSYTEQGAEFSLNFYTLDAQTYAFASSTGKYEQYQYGLEIYLDPVRVHSSFENAYGVFGAFNYSSRVVRF